ncbi:TadE-like protein [Streptomyces sp. ADI96-15]|uniref:TadE family protein n=2 Tax=Streptomyces TaxID=1883 RepID=UPI00068410F6|nr:TadE family protein [Streptomyces sp. 604F]MBP3079208.1 pilus assembly protein TadG [Streptomyces sp. 604F]RPK71376.1 TadE-like protein [Streptomyces sp. ADI96-15]UYM24132.1 pilus assembly protein [Streptomyces albus]WDV32618.1 pilus assembly protein [Streptomyces sp. AD16]
MQPVPRRPGPRGGARRACRAVPARGSALRRFAASRRAAAKGSGDSGMTAIEFVFLTPILFFMIFATVQFALYFFADHVAQAAAQAGARKARATADENPGGWRGEARTVANAYIRQLGPQLVVSPNVTMLQPEPNTVGVEITARIPTVFPGLDLTVHAQSSGPVERFVEEGG